MRPDFVGGSQLPARLSDVAEDASDSWHEVFQSCSTIQMKTSFGQAECLHLFD
jgi:hypothetical protein